MVPDPETPLSSVPGWTPAHTQKLASSWITSAEQIVGMAADPRTRKSLAAQLQVSEDELGSLVEKARRAIPPGIAEQLSRPVDTRDYGLGALPPDDQG